MIVKQLEECIVKGSIYCKKRTAVSDSSLLEFSQVSKFGGCYSPNPCKHKQKTHDVFKCFPVNYFQFFLRCGVLGLPIARGIGPRPPCPLKTATELAATSSASYKLSSSSSIYRHMQRVHVYL